MKIDVYASGSSGNCYRISDGRTTLLLEAGIPLSAIRRATGFTMSQVAGCLITHAHGDHAKAAAQLAKSGVDLYTGGGTIDALNLTGHRIHAVKSLAEFRLGSFKILPFDVEHDAPEPLGFLCTSTATGDKLLYFTDTYFIRYRFQGLTHIMCECNHSAELIRDSASGGAVNTKLAVRVVGSHMSLEHLLGFLRANDLSRVRQIYLLHMSRDNADPEHFKEVVARETGTEVYIA